jgi:RND superfamily putative drug exporter
MNRSALTIPAGPRSKWIVLVVWLAVAFISVGPPGLWAKFEDAEGNGTPPRPPAGSESAAAQKATNALQDGELLPAIVVFRRSSGLTAADRETIVEDVGRMTERRFPGVVEEGRKAPAGGRPGATPVPVKLDRPPGCRSVTMAVPDQPPGYAPFAGPTCSSDGKAANVVAYIRNDGGGRQAVAPVRYWRERLGGGKGGLQAKITGSAAFSTDGIEAFEGVNGTLLLATAVLIALLLIVIYRSPTFFLIPLATVLFAELLARALGYGLTELGVTLDGRSSTIMTALVLGAGTGYALLLIARYREELRHGAEQQQAMRTALAAAGPTILASAAIAIAAFLCLLIAKVDATASLGAIAAAGIACAALAALTLLPALLTIAGRRAFWPAVPGPAASAPDGHLPEGRASGEPRPWKRVGDRVARSPRRIAGVSIATLLVLCAGLTFFSSDLTREDAYRSDVESAEGQRLLDESFPPGMTAPVDAIATFEEEGTVRVALEAVKGVETVTATVAKGPRNLLVQAALESNPYSPEALDVVGPMRAEVHHYSPGSLVGGPTAAEYDIRQAAGPDSLLIAPIVALVVFLILAGLLRSVVAPLVLIGTTVLSTLAALGVGSFAFDLLFGYPGSDPALPLLAFVFLIALGAGYDALLAATGAAAWAGIALAGAFAVLAALPFTFLTELGFVVAIGVLLDTFLVRGVLVPAIALSLGDRFWWPSPPPSPRRAPTESAGTALSHTA